LKSTTKEHVEVLGARKQIACKKTRNAEGVWKMIKNEKKKRLGPGNQEQRKCITQGWARPSLKRQEKEQRKKKTCREIIRAHAARHRKGNNRVRREACERGFRSFCRQRSVGHKYRKSQIKEEDHHSNVWLNGGSCALNGGKKRS